MNFVGLPEDRAEKIWQNTRRFETATSELATLYDLLQGLEISGIPNFGNFLYEGPQHTVIQREKLGGALDRIVVNWDGKLAARADFGDGRDYEGGSLGYTPSVLLSSEDLIHNPELLELLIGELFPPMVYYDGLVTKDRNYRELVLFYRDAATRQRQVGYQDAMNESKRIAYRVVEETMKKSDSDGKFRRWNKQGGDINMGIVEDTIVVDGISLYHIGVLGLSEIKIRRLQERLRQIGDNHKAVEEIQGAMEVHMDGLRKKEGAYFPRYKILEYQPAA